MDHEVFRKFVTEHGRGIFVMIRTRVKSDSDAEDIMQEVLFKIYKGLDKFRGDAQVRTWVYRIVTNSIADHYRQPWWRFVSRQKEDYGESQDEMPADQEVSPALDPLQALLLKERGEWLMAGLNRMPSLEKETFLLRFMEGFSLEQISEALNMNINTVKTHLYRAVKKIRKQLAESDENM